MPQTPTCKNSLFYHTPNVDKITKYLKIQSKIHYNYTATNLTINVMDWCQKMIPFVH